MSKIKWYKELLIFNISDHKEPCLELWDCVVKTKSHLEYNGENDKDHVLRTANLHPAYLKTQKKLEVKVDFEAFYFSVEKFSKGSVDWAQVSAGLKV